MEGVWEEVGEEVGGGSAHSAVQSVGINYSAKNNVIHVKYLAVLLLCTFFKKYNFFTYM